MREKIRTRQYVMSTYAEEEMDHDNLTIFDVEHALLTGRIIERQKDQETGEWKYLVRGQSLTGAPIVAAAKLSFTGKLVILTVYVDW
jgi:hypothetical protein